MKPRVAVVDLLLHSPPKGGACIDVLSTFKRLEDDFDIKLFCVRWPDGVSGRGVFDSPLELPVELLQPTANREDVIASIERALDAWKPDLAFVADGWTLKPYLINALRRRRPVVARFYAYEGLCPRNNERWLPDGACPNHALADCERCLSCAKSYYDIVREKRNGADNPLTEEMRIAGIFDGGYERVLKASLDGLHAIVYNKGIAEILRVQGKSNVSVVPGGVDAEIFSPGPARNPGDIFEILVAGRMSDPAKGADTAIEAGCLLAATGFKFRMTMTRPQGPDSSKYPWLNECGWKSPAELAGLMRDSDCSVAPSRWQEAFGMVWAESMSAGLPVIASAVAGPLEYVVEGENGLLFPPGDAQKLAACIARLAGDGALRAKLVDGGLRTAKGMLSWDFAAKATRRVILEALRPLENKG